MKFCVYIHERLDTNEVFYVGVSNNNRRPFTKSNRNRIWNSITSKTDFKVTIVYSDLTQSEALEKEMELILKYGKISNKTGTLANVTDGGDYSVKYVTMRGISSENRSKLAKKLWQDSKWRNDVISKFKSKRNTPEYKQYISNLVKNRVHKPLSEESKRKISEANSRIFNTPEWKTKRSIAAKGSNGSKYDHTIRVFKHKNGCIFVGTKYELQQEFNIPPTNFHILLKHPNRTWHGWKLINSYNPESTFKHDRNEMPNLPKSSNKNNRNRQRAKRR